MKMIDISDKDTTEREAVVKGVVSLKPSVLLAIKRKKIPKGDVLEAAKIAGILAAKKTPTLIPLCHPISIEYANIDFSLGKGKIMITTTVKGKAKTGVEMEAFVATAVCALTVYDMCKALDREITISSIRLFKKSGGKSGIYLRRNTKNLKYI